MFFHSTENWKRRGRAKHFSRYSGKSQPTPNFILARGSVSEQENQGPTTSCWLVQRQGQPRPGLRIPSYCQARSLSSVAFLAKDLLLRVTHLLCPVCSSTGSPWGKWEWGQWDRTQQELRWGKMNSLMSGATAPPRWHSAASHGDTGYLSLTADWKDKWWRESKLPRGSKTPLLDFDSGDSFGCFQGINLTMEGN